MDMQQRTATGYIRYRIGSLRCVAGCCSCDASTDTADCVACQHPGHEPCLLRPASIGRVRSAAAAQHHLETVAFRSARLQMVSDAVHSIWNGFPQHSYRRRNRQVS